MTGSTAPNDYWQAADGLRFLSSCIFVRFGFIAMSVRFATVVRMASVCAAASWLLGCCVDTVAAVTHGGPATPVTLSASKSAIVATSRPCTTIESFVSLYCGLSKVIDKLVPYFPFYRRSSCRFL